MRRAGEQEQSYRRNGVQEMEGIKYQGEMGNVVWKYIQGIKEQR